MELVIPAVCLAVAGVASALCLRRGWVWPYWIAMFGLMAGFAVNTSIDNRTPGFDGLDNAIYAGMIFAPALIGGGLGGVVGGWLRRRG